MLLFSVSCLSLSLPLSVDCEKIILEKRVADRVEEAETRTKSEKKKTKIKIIFKMMKSYKS